MLAAGERGMEELDLDYTGCKSSEETLTRPMLHWKMAEQPAKVEQFTESWRPASTWCCRQARGFVRAAVCINVKAFEKGTGISFSLQIFAVAHEKSKRSITASRGAAQNFLHGKPEFQRCSNLRLMHAFIRSSTNFQVSSPPLAFPPRLVAYAPFRVLLIPCAS